MLERPCPECGLDAAAVELADVPELVLANAAGWQDVLAAPTSAGARGRACGRRSSTPATSATCSACSTAASRLMLAEDDPQFANWDQDAHGGQPSATGEQDPATVAAELQAAAEAIAASFAAVAPEQWDRRGRRSDGAVFTVQSFGRYFIHDPVHHLHDVTLTADARTTGSAARHSRNSASQGLDRCGPPPCRSTSSGRGS